MNRWPCLVVLASLAVMSCGDGGTPADSTTSATSPLAELVTVDGISYHSDSTLDWFPPLLDVYAPVDGEALPVVVMFHGGPGSVNKDWLTSLATATAQAGAVVFVPNWSSGSAPLDPDEALAVGLREADASACAVSYALEHAAEYGGDPEELIVFGHSAGAMEASVVSLRSADPFDDCVVDMRTFEPDGVVLWEGDWLTEDPYWDHWEAGLPTVAHSITPWTWLGSDHKPPIALVVTRGALDELVRCEASATDGWLPWRDPDGWFAIRFQQSGALDDACLDVGETSALLADTMREQGFTVDEVSLPDSQHMYLAPADRATMVEVILAVTSTSR